MTRVRRGLALQHIRNILKQAWPVLITSWASLAYGVMDTAMAGHASAADLQAMALTVSIYILVFVGLMGVVHALIPILAQHYGAQRFTELGHSWGQGVWLALGLSAVGALALAFPELWLSLSGDIDADVRQSVTWYLRALMAALPAALIFRTIYCLGTAVSRPQVVMTINVISLGFKLLFNWVFIFGKLGIPAMGAVGAGISTALVYWMTMTAGLWFIHRDPYFRRFRLRIRRPHLRDQLELLRLGLPMGGSYLIEVATFTFMALLIAREGMYATGGHQIMSNISALCYMMPMAIGVASASLTAQAIGAQDFRLAQDRGRAGLTVAIAGAIITSLVLIFGQHAILRVYTDDPQLAAMAAALMQLLPFFHMADAMQCMGSYLLRAYKVAVVPLLLQIVALTGVGLIGGWWLAFGPAAGSLQGVVDLAMPGAPTGAATMWLMAFASLSLSATLLFFWYAHIVRTHARRQYT